MARARIWQGDNLDLLKELPDNHVDLVCTDPPYNMDRVYSETVPGNPTQRLAYKNTFDWNPEVQEDYWRFTMERGDKDHIVYYLEGEKLRLLDKNPRMFSYQVSMALRLVEMHRVLKENGILLLHCDPTLNGSLRKLGDLIFGDLHLVNEIIWQRSGAHNRARRLGPIHDTIYMWSKSDDFNDFTWNSEVRHTKALEKIVKRDSKGNWCDWKDLTAPGAYAGICSDPWKGVDIRARGRNWQIPNALKADYYTITKIKLILWNPDSGKDRPAEAPGCRILNTIEMLDALEAEDLVRVRRAKGGQLIPEYKIPVNRKKGVPLQDIFYDIQGVRGQEDLNVPTQKPVELLKRLIGMCTKEGDLVLDPFLGVGTVADAALKLNRTCIGMEISPEVIAKLEGRLDRLYGPESFEIEKYFPASFEAFEVTARRLIEEHRTYPLQKFTMENLLNGKSNKPGPDRRVDGWIYLEGIPGVGRKTVNVQVKTGGLNLVDFDSLESTVKRDGAYAGIMVCFEREVTGGMRKLADSKGRFETQDPSDHRSFYLIQIVTFESLYNPSLRHGGIDLPGHIVRPDYKPIREPREPPSVPQEIIMAAKETRDAVQSA